MALDVRLPPVSFQVFGASGDDHSPGLVPDPGATAGTTRFLREDGQFATALQSIGLFTATAPGLVPASGGGTVNFLRADATFAVPPSPAPTIALKTFINVTDPAYGAVGDGITDNTAALTAAVAFMLTLPAGGCLYFPAGRYHFASTQTITYPLANALFDCTIIGDGQDATTLQWTTGDGMHVVFNSLIASMKQSFHCRDMSFVTAAANTGNALIVQQNGTNVGSSASLTELTRVTFMGVDGPSGITSWLNELTITGISNVNIVGCGMFGNALSNTGAGVQFEGQNSTDIATVLNMSGTTINGKNIGFSHGDFIQGTTITGGCNITGCTVGVSMGPGLSGTDAQLVIADSQIGTFVNGGASIAIASALNVLIIDNMTFVLANGNSTLSGAAGVNIAIASNFSVTNCIFQCTNHAPVGHSQNIAVAIAGSVAGSAGILDNNSYSNFDTAEALASTAANIRLGQRNFINCTTNTANGGTNNNAVFLGATPSGQFQAQIQNAAGISGAHGLLIACGSTAASDSGTVVASFANGNNSNIVGSITRTAGGGVAYNVTSDERIKCDIVPTATGIAVLRRLRVVDYTARDDSERERRQGVIAQQIYEHWPQAVRKGGPDAAMQPWLVSLPDFVPLTMRATQELADVIDAQAETIKELRGLNAGLESRIVDLEHAMAEMVDKFAD